MAQTGGSRGGDALQRLASPGYRSVCGDSTTGCSRAILAFPKADPVIRLSTQSCPQPILGLMLLEQRTQLPEVAPLRVFVEFDFQRIARLVSQRRIERVHELVPVRNVIDQLL